MGVLAPFLAIVVAGVSERIQSDSANQPVSPRRKCAASATYWVAMAISREARGFEDAPTSGGSDRGEELHWAFPRDGPRVILPTGARRHTELGSFGRLIWISLPFEGVPASAGSGLGDRESEATRIL